MSQPIRVKIDVSKIDKSQLFKGVKGTYLDLYLYPTPDDKYGNDFRVTQDVSKEARQAGQKGAILGNAKFAGQKPQGEHSSRPPAARAAQRPKPPEPDLDAPEDDIPF